MKLYKGILATLFSTFLLMGVAACQEKGAAEKAGEAIDDAAADIADKAEDTADEIKKKMD
jgi:hypothetical protein